MRYIAVPLVDTSQQIPQLCSVTSRRNQGSDISKGPGSSTKGQMHFSFFFSSKPFLKWFTASLYRTWKDKAVFSTQTNDVLELTLVCIYASWCSRLPMTKPSRKQMGFFLASDCRIHPSFMTIRIHWLSLKTQNYFAKVEKTSKYFTNFKKH